ncbi:tyrosine--tRNA ligase MSY1 [Sugiyamaella lignohabitans]|uniref:Tyrosine--tRNA ligase n=1 Tax=Sugiyamaella lignohabitans TaxID=796027 RepID=A0A161HN82_9ASCO|nr:tyrosine--tRNA ligase MSY1 [Sugiyamaella lignohabitans]ANB15537.1 tyrosine--tRNA ligase MSY1 [Sugiyamaella lignohabitans]
MLRGKYSSIYEQIFDYCALLTFSSELLESQVLQSGKKITLYCGADPTAQSLHLGNLIPLLVLLHFYIRGHNVISLVGGATGVVGDPSGRNTERQQMVDQTRENNILRIQHQMKQFIDQGWKYAVSKGYTSPGTAVRANNADWWKDMSMLHFLGTYGRHIRVSHMLARESVKNRLSSEQGIGFNEFTYQILQAYDFWHLYKTQNCSVQVGGNDQWGNITAGIDLISRLRSFLKEKNESNEALSEKPAESDAFGLTVPLLTTPSGEKFGKSAGNAVWIDRDLTKPYDLFQYFVQTPDSVVEQYLKLFTLIPLEEIPDIIQEHDKDPELRLAQRRLASEVADLVHGIGSGKRAELISSILFPTPSQKNPQYSSSEILEAFENEKLLHHCSRVQVVGNQWRSVLATITGKSKSECSRMIKAGGVYYGFARTMVVEGILGEEHLEDNQLLLVRLGKSKYHVIKVE